MNSNQWTASAVAIALAPLALALIPNITQAQTFPSKPLRIIVASAPGVPSDILSRGLTEPLGRALGQPIVVENRVGADGIIGTEACAKSTPDGHTLCGTASNVMIWNPVLRKDLPYNPVRDFAPVVQVGGFDSALVAHPSVPANSFAQLAELTKARPDSVNWGHFGVNSTGYMYQAWLKKSRGLPFYAVPYKTQPQVLQAMLSGEASVAVYSLTNVEGPIKAGKLKALAVTSAKRLTYVPEVPTFEELGIKLPLRTWYGYHFPIAVPKVVVLRMNTEIRKIMADASYKANVLDRMGVVAADDTPEEFDAYIRATLKEVGELVAYLGIKPE